MTTPAEAPARARRWYGWQTLVADGSTLTVLPLLASQVDTDGGVAVTAVVLSYLLVPPIIHTAHGRGGIGAASLGLRLGMPIGGAAVGFLAAGNCNGGSYCQVAGAAVGFVLGVMGAIAIDAAALSYDRPEPARTARPRAPAIAFHPVAGPRKEGGFDLGFGATF